MIRREIRRRVKDKKGRTHDKLICMALAKEDKIYISIKEKGYPEPILVNIFDILEPYVDENVIKEVKNKVSKTYKRLKNKAS